MDKHTKDKTALQYIYRKAPSSVTPTFCYVQPYIVGRTLDIGMGVGKYLEKFPDDSIGIDVSEVNIRIAKEKGLNVVQADINEGLPFSDSSFQAVFCSHVIEHVDSPLNLLREANRVLKPGGNLILAIPVEKTIVRLIREDYFKGHRTHLYGLSVECTERLLEEVGLQVIARYYNFPILNRIPFIDRILQSISSKHCQYISTMYWIVARKGN